MGTQKSVISSARVEVARAMMSVCIMRESVINAVNVPHCTATDGLMKTPRSVAIKARGIGLRTYSPV